MERNPYGYCRSELSPAIDEASVVGLDQLVTLIEMNTTNDVVVSTTYLTI